jgi:hypothetical protein
MMVKNNFSNDPDYTHFPSKDNIVKNINVVFRIPPQISTFYLHLGQKLKRHLLDQRILRNMGMWFLKKVWNRLSCSYFERNFKKSPDPIVWRIFGDS